MEIQEHKHGAVTVLRPAGPMADPEAAAFGERLGEVRRAALGRVVVDLAACPFVDSRGLETLAEESERMAESGRVLRLCGVNETVREVLELTGLAPLFEHYEDATDAVRSFL